MSLTSADFSVQSDAEREVRGALAAYKFGLISTHYRNWWHRLGCWCGDNEAMSFDAALANAEAHARITVNKSAEHQNWVRVISSQQPHDIRERDKFLSLLFDRSRGR